jgi:hypothetical protein
MEADPKDNPGIGPFRGVTGCDIDDGARASTVEGRVAIKGLG